MGNDPSQTAGSGSSADPSNPDGTGTPTVEVLQARLDQSEKDRVTLQQSVQGLVPFKDEVEAGRKRIAELEAEVVSPGVGEEGEYLTRAQATELAQKTTSDGIKSYVLEQNRIQVEAGKKKIAFDEERQKWLVLAEKEFPDAKDMSSELVKLATTIYEDPNSGLSTSSLDAFGRNVRTDTHVSAQYDAVSRAAKQIADKGAVASDAKIGANFAGSGGGGGGGGSPGASGEISNEEFLAMTPEQQSAYQNRQFENKS